MTLKRLEDEDLMPFGIHKGLQMADVPAKYLLWLYENNRTGPLVRIYIEENWDILHNEIKNHET